MSTRSSTSSEIEAVLRRKALELLATPRRRCCEAKFPVGHELRTAEEFKRAAAGCRTSFVMFFGRTCPYCRAFDPIFRNVGSKYADLANFVKAEVELFAYQASLLGVMGTPTTVAFAGGEAHAALPGFAIAPVFESFVLENLRSVGCA